MPAPGTYRCLNCGTDFAAPRSERNKGGAKFCTRTCAGTFNARKRNKVYRGRMALLREWALSGRDIDVDCPHVTVHDIPEAS